MTLNEYVKGKVLKYLKIDKLEGTPNDNRLTFISDDEAIRVENIRANKIWYIGDGDELLNYYTNQAAYGWVSNPIYNRNRRNYFWGISSVETNIKRIHSGIPRALIDTITNIVGLPKIKTDPRWERIADNNNFSFRLLQQVRPMSLVEGDGCWKINFNTKLSKTPLFEYYGAEDWEPIVQSEILMGIIFKSYYKDSKDRNYVLIETRSLEEDGCLIEYNLFRLGKKNDLSEADFENVPELAWLKDNPRQFIGVRKLFAQPVKFYYNPLYKNRGKSLYDGAIDFFDMLDEIWSQASQTDRVSTPVEYYDTSILDRTRDGIPILPTKYNRQYVATVRPTTGDGVVKQDGIVTTQPDLNFDKYGMLASDVLSYILIGRLSPSSLGIDVAKKDNAEAQREKEKQTLFTRNTIIDQETKQLKELINMALIIQDYLDTGVMNNTDYDVSITYDEFANPSFESELQILGPALSQGHISIKQYLRLLWGDKLDEAELAEEQQYLEENQQKDDLDLEAMMNANANNENLPGQEQAEEPIIEAEE